MYVEASFMKHEWSQRRILLYLLFIYHISYIKIITNMGYIGSLSVSDRYRVASCYWSCHIGLKLRNLDRSYSKYLNFGGKWRTVDWDKVVEISLRCVPCFYMFNTRRKRAWIHVYGFRSVTLKTYISKWSRKEKGPREHQTQCERERARGQGWSLGDKDQPGQSPDHQRNPWN